MKQVTLIVLAAGVGKRFWPLATSKALFPFMGLPMFARVIADVPQEVTQMIIVTNPQNEAQIRSYTFPIPTSTVVQEKPRGMADAMLAVQSAISGPILIINADDIIDSDLLTRVIKTENFGAIPGVKRKGPFGYIKFDGGRPVGIIEKPLPGEEPSEFANITCHYISDSTDFFEELAKTKSTGDDVYEKALSRVMAQHEFSFIPYEGSFVPLKYPWHVLDVMQGIQVQKYIGKNVDIKTNVIIEGNVYIEDGVKIFENSKIVGPCYIGKNTIIGNNTIIRESHIGDNCVIGFTCDVTRSYIGNDCWLHSNYVGDSILESNVSMGGGAKLANLRLDDGEIRESGRNKLGAIVGSGARIGVNASIMPGVKIGKNSFVGSGVVLDKDIPDDSFCTMEAKLVIKKNTHTISASRAQFKKNL